MGSEKFWSVFSTSINRLGEDFEFFNELWTSAHRSDSSENIKKNFQAFEAANEQNRIYLLKSDIALCKAFNKYLETLNS